MRFMPSADAKARIGRLRWALRQQHEQGAVALDLSGFARCLKAEHDLQAMFGNFPFPERRLLSRHRHFEEAYAKRLGHPSYM
jgi:hypothetical protein